MRSPWRVVAERRYAEAQVVVYADDYRTVTADIRRTSLCRLAELRRQALDLYQPLDAYGLRPRDWHPVPPADEVAPRRMMRSAYPRRIGCDTVCLKDLPVPNVDLPEVETAMETT